MNLNTTLPGPLSEKSVIRNLLPSEHFKCYAYILVKLHNLNWKETGKALLLNVLLRRNRGNSKVRP